MTASLTVSLMSTTLPPIMLAAAEASVLGRSAMFEAEVRA